MIGTSWNGRQPSLTRNEKQMANRPGVRIRSWIDQRRSSHPSRMGSLCPRPKANDRLLLSRCVLVCAMSCNIYIIHIFLFFIDYILLVGSSLASSSRNGFRLEQSQSDYRGAIVVHAYPRKVVTSSILGSLDGVQSLKTHLIRMLRRTGESEE
jgi:hypothetical protein